MSRLAVIRVRRERRAIPGVKDSFRALNLKRKNCCVLLDNKPETMGMIRKAKDYITWGEVSDDVVNMLKARDKGRKYFALNPPKMGYGRKGVKIPFKNGGALGYRGEGINDLLKRMM